jgi:hypothetical protein
VNHKLRAEKTHASLLKNIPQDNSKKYRIVIKPHTHRMYATILPLEHGSLLSEKNIKYKCLREYLHIRMIN